MRIFEIYTKDIILRDFWNKLEESLEINEGETGLTNYLSLANEIIFKKFGINPSDKVYFIAGSARLYLYPELREAFGLTSQIGDLDIVIPYKKFWIQAGLEEEWNNGGIYRPTNDASIEAFNVWDPARAGGAYADYKVRPTNDILRDANMINGYYFMSLADIIDYKMALNRDKEQEVVNLIKQYQGKNTMGRSEFLNKMIKLIGINNTKNFLGIVGK
ncbi:MAG TPA: hypothetical protein P5241_03875 [Candidatus Paceibacterota bacterium]|nr:hypothetical protein [Candidatus Paceibacterota bacterium]